MERPLIQEGYPIAGIWGAIASHRNCSYPVGVPVGWNLQRVWLLDEPESERTHQLLLLRLKGERLEERWRTRVTESAFLLSLRHVGGCPRASDVKEQRDLGKSSALWNKAPLLISITHSHRLNMQHPKLKEPRVWLDNMWSMSEILGKSNSTCIQHVT